MPAQGHRRLEAWIWHKVHLTQSALPTVSSLRKDATLLCLMCSAARQLQGPLLLKRDATGRGTEVLSRTVLGRAAVLERAYLCGPHSTPLGTRDSNMVQVVQMPPSNE